MNDLASRVLSTLLDEFTDLADAEEATRACVRMLVAVFLGGLLGYERESRGMAAGLRTHMLVALGSALFVLVPLQAGMTLADLSRVQQGVVSGIGFLGAGAIIKLSREREIRGITTAASIWLTAAIGMAVGMGMVLTSIFATFLALIILALLYRFKSDHQF